MPGAGRRAGPAGGAIAPERERGCDRHRHRGWDRDRDRGWDWDRDSDWDWDRDRDSGWDPAMPAPCPPSAGSLGNQAGVEMGSSTWSLFSGNLTG